MLSAQSRAVQVQFYSGALFMLSAQSGAVQTEPLLSRTDFHCLFLILCRLLLRFHSATAPFGTGSGTRTHTVAHWNLKEMSP